MPFSITYVCIWGLQSRSGHPEVLPATIGLPEGQKIVDLRPEEHPYFLNMPMWNPPGLLRDDAKMTDGFTGYHTDVFWYIPENLRQTLGLDDKTAVEIVNQVKPHNVAAFARAIAKVAYCTAILKYGFDGFRPLIIPQLILGTYPHISYFVGPYPRPHRPPNQRGQQHFVEFGNTTYKNLKLLHANVRLFADSSAPQSGMPVYLVILGVEGRRRVIPKRILPNPRRPILL